MLVVNKRVIIDIITVIGVNDDVLSVRSYLTSDQFVGVPRGQCLGRFCLEIYSKYSIKTSFCV